MSKGLVSYVIRERTKYFQTSSPARLMDYIDKKERDFQERKKEIKNLIPELEQKQKFLQRSQSAQIFEGFEGVKTVFQRILETCEKGEEYYSFTIGLDLKQERVMRFLLNYHQKRIDRKVKVKILANKREKLLFTKLSKLKDLQIKYHENKVPLGMLISKDYVANFSFKDVPVAFLIKSQPISKSYLDFFQSLWKTAKE